MIWTTYDGTPDTLPPIGVLVIVDDGYDPFTLYHDKHACLPITTLMSVGDKWLPIPTEQQCEAWAKEALKLSLWQLGSNTDRAKLFDEFVIRASSAETVDALRESLVAIEAAETNNQKESIE